MTSGKNILYPLQFYIMSKINSTPPGGDEPLMPPNDHKITEIRTRAKKGVKTVLLDESKELNSEVANQSQWTKGYFTTLLEDLKVSQKDYDFSDYEDQLLLSDSEIEKVLKNRLFSPHGKDVGLQSLYGEYLASHTKYKKHVNQKLITDLLDRVYESNPIIKPIEHLWRQRSISFKDKKQLFEEVRLNCASWARSLNLEYNSLSDSLYPEELLELAEISWKSWIRQLNLRGNNFAKIHKAPDFLDQLAQISWESWMRHLNLSHNYLSQTLCIDDFLKFIKAAWESWIRYLNLGYNLGLRNPSLKPNELGPEQFNTDDLFALIKTAWESWIRWLDLSNNSLSKKINNKNIIKFLEIIGMSWIKILNLKDNGFYYLMTGKEKKEADSIIEKYRLIIQI